MLCGDILHMSQPVFDKSETGVLVCRPNTTAAIVAADDNVFHLQNVHSKLKHRETVEVGVNDDVCDVSMNKNITREEVDYLIRWDSAIGATYPEVLRVLALREALKEFGVIRPHPVSPDSVLVEKVIKKSHRISLRKAGLQSLEEWVPRIW